MKKAKIYIPSKTAMQSGKGKSKNWLLEFDTKDHQPTLLWVGSPLKILWREVKLEFSTKEKAINFAKKNNIAYKIIEPKKEL